MFTLILRGPWSGRKLFELCTRHGLFVRLPFIGAGNRDPETGNWAWDWWSDLKATGEV